MLRVPQQDSNVPTLRDTPPGQEVPVPGMKADEEGAKSHPSFTGFIGL